METAQPQNQSNADAMQPDIPATSQVFPHDPKVARSLLGLPGLPTIVAIGPFEDRAHSEQLAAAFSTVRRRCQVQLVLLGTGPERAVILRRTLAQGFRTNVHVERDLTGERWEHLVAAADVVVPCVAAGPRTLLDVLAAGRPVVVPADPVAVQLVVPASTGLVYRSGDVPAMARALIRLLASPTLRAGMGCRASEVARRYQGKPVMPQWAGH
jgi:glycosyltransferase involved in cell wall biosynthesis